MKPILLCGIAALTSALNAKETPPNILWIVSDDHSWNQIACGGDPNLKTPRIDQLAAEGMNFTRAYTTSCQCLPSRASFLTGRGPVEIGMTRFTTPLHRHIRIFPELLKENGFFTAIAGRAHHIDGWSYTQTIPELFRKHQLPNASARFDFARDSNHGTSEERRDEFFRHLDEFFEARPADKPFFLQFNFLDPHLPVSSRELNPFARQYDPQTLILPEDFPDTPAFREDYALFLGLVSRLDHDVGRVLDILDEKGLRENTLVVLVGDNGGAVFRGKGTLYERGIRVPMIVRWPGKVKPGTTSQALISGEDLAPTMLDALGMTHPPGNHRKIISACSVRQTPPGAQGSLLHPLRPRRSAAQQLLMLRSRPLHRHPHPQAHLQRHLADPLLARRFLQPPLLARTCRNEQSGKLDPKFQKLLFSPTRPMFELFDLTKDPLELENLAGKPGHQAIEHDLRLRLTEWMLLQNDYLPLPAPDAPPER
jgi:N-sulfoglucosamine sulfohydrolase